MKLFIAVIELVLAILIISYGVIYKEPYGAAVGGFMLCESGEMAWEIIKNDK